MLPLVLGLALVTAAPAAPSRPADVIHAFVQWTPSAGAPRDAANPYASRVLSLGAKAVPLLVAALKKDPQKTQAVWMLGQIGDPRALGPLLELWQVETSPGAKQRLAISAGASMSMKNTAALVTEAKRAGGDAGLSLLRDATGTNVGADFAAWEKWLASPQNVRAAVERARKLSVPQNG